MGKEYSLDEAWKACREMGPLKALSPDWVPSSIFPKDLQNHGPALFDFLRNVLEKGDVPPGSNESLLVLIPKEEKPSSIKGF